MTADPEHLMDVAGRISDEVAVDWDREASAHPETKRFLLQLQSLEKLARFRSRSAGAGSPETAPGLFQWGSLRVLEKLGEGGFAEVFRAWDPALEREVALKLRRPDTERTESGTRAWLEEARRLARVRHPHVVAIYGAEIRESRVGMWMERVAGKTLEEVLGDHGPLGAREAALIGVELCGALAAVHGAGMLHGDVKTTNVMREAGGRIVLMDFGAGSEMVPGPTEGAAVTFATPLVSAPEVLRGGGMRVESDLYALGVLLYRLVTARHPVIGEGFEEIRGKIERGEIVPLRDLRPDLSPAFVEVVTQALRIDPAERFPSAGAMEAALVRAIGVPGTATSGVPAASIAVLPMRNLSDDASNDYFADGLAEELLNNLARIQGLRVTGRTSSFQFKGQGEDLREVGRRLNVETVLEGSVRRAGNRVRIAVQLVHAAEGHQLWSHTYDRDLVDIFAVQEDIARAVAAALKVALLRTGAGRSRPIHSEAYDAALLGRYFHRRGSRDDLAKAIGYFEKATELDPSSGMAWAGLGLARLRQASHGHAPLEDGYKTARMAAQRAIALEPDLPDGHTLHAMVLMEHDWNWDAADIEFKRAMALDPGHAGCTSNAAWLANVLGRHDEAMELSRRASELDPLSVSNWSNRGMFAWYGRQWGEAEAMYRKALELDPAFPLTHAKLGRVYLAAGRLEGAMAEMKAERNEPFRLQGLSMVHHGLGQAAESEAALAQLIEKYEEGGAFQIAEACAYRGDADGAFEWFERAYAQRDVGLISLKGRPLLESLERDPRWPALLLRMRLPI